MGDSEILEESLDKSCSSEEGEYTVSNSSSSAATSGGSSHTDPAAASQNESDDFGFRVGFDAWSPEPTAGISYLSLIPIDYFGAGYEFAPGIDDYTGKIKRNNRKSRLWNRRGAVVLHSNPLGKEWQAEKKLHTAVSAGDYRAVCKLLTDGVNPSAADDKHRTPLHVAAAKGVEDIVRALLSYGADPNMKDILGNTPLHLAVFSNHIGVITSLLRGGANAGALDRNGRTPLHLAHSRLTRDQNPACFTSQQLRKEVIEIIGMLKMYMSSMGCDGEVHQLEALSVKLEGTTTKEEVDEIQEMLVGFTNMSLKKQSDTS
ncbi:ankyrin repeat domain-containing protein 54-like [Ptychodera flava]|uniref:ankyrin repeat domain-containing protein 54-like n=1 Tax=Ptychodera flava TaxID=63121 RepID=UPI00396A7F68